MITIRDLEYLGKALGILRRRADLMQKQVSIRTGMSRSQVSRYERGRDVPNLTTLVKYLEVVSADFRLLHRALMQVKQASGEPAPGLTPAIDSLEAALIPFLEPVVNRVLSERVQLLGEELRTAGDTGSTVDLNDLLARLERVDAALGPDVAAEPTPAPSEESQKPK